MTTALHKEIVIAQHRNELEYADLLRLYVTNAKVINLNDYKRKHKVKKNQVFQCCKK